MYKRFNTYCLFKLALTQKYRQYRKKRKQTQWWSGAGRICVLEMQGPQNISIGYQQYDRTEPHNPNTRESSQYTGSDTLLSIFL